MDQIFRIDGKAFENCTFLDYESYGKIEAPISEMIFENSSRTCSLFFASIYITIIIVIILS